MICSFDEKRLQDLKIKIEEAIKLLSQYEEKRDLSDDPRERKRCENEIAFFKAQVSQYRQEYNEIKTEPELAKIDQSNKGLPSMNLSMDIESLLKPFTIKIPISSTTFPLNKPKNPDQSSIKRKGDYRRLREFLASQKWKDADLETMQIILKITNREQEQWLRVKEDIEQISDEDIRIMNTIWERYSSDKFGFRVQQQIWNEVGGSYGQFDYGSYIKFGRTVGWCIENEWINSYQNFTFSLNAPPGHLPTLRLETARYNSWKSNFTGFLQRVSNCLIT